MSVWITRRPGRWQVSKQHAPLRGLTGLAENTVKQTTKTVNLALKTTEARATGNEWNYRFWMCAASQGFCYRLQKLFFPFFLRNLLQTFSDVNPFSLWSILFTLAISSYPPPRTSTAHPTPMLKGLGITYLRREKKRSTQKELKANGKYIALQLTDYRSPTYPLTCSQVYGNSWNDKKKK